MPDPPAAAVVDRPPCDRDATCDHSQRIIIWRTINIVISPSIGDDSVRVHRSNEGRRGFGDLLCRDTGRARAHGFMARWFALLDSIPGRRTLELLAAESRRGETQR